MATYKIAVIPGDGIGPEVTTEGLKVLTTVSQKLGFNVTTTFFPFGATYYLSHNQVLPPDAFQKLSDNQALLLGAVGDPKVPPGILEQDLLLNLRFYFDQFLNLRPAKSYEGAFIPVKLLPDRKIDLVVVRENTEDLYMNFGGMATPPLHHHHDINRQLYQGDLTIDIQLTPNVPVSYTVGLLSLPGVRRVARRAFQIAKSRNEKVLYAATKANALPVYYTFWDKIITSISEEFPDIKLVLINVDNLAYQLVRSPENFGVILCPNLFGDIISDLTAGITGGLGLAASANIGEKLSMFEPVHGSAPTIAKTGKANPLAAILSVALLLDFLGEKEGSLLIDRAVTEYLKRSPLVELPVELGGQSLTPVVGDLVSQVLKEL
ncbi:MAG: isocitrate/isopropylmalate dehydrogenase family protein [Deltaproteobacteria bacterium]|jgi:3-isopropylmalate dehydrogenase|nr:isocitrate/isopropylmalate dehydrogenase family protein [Deltaproteobacteria bacterium]